MISRGSFFFLGGGEATFGVSTMVVLDSMSANINVRVTVNASISFTSSVPVSVLEPDQCLYKSQIHCHIQPHCQ